MPITKTSQISSKNGDTGSSTNFVNESFQKDHILFDTLGTMDELSSFLGLAYHYVSIDFIKKIQKTIQDLNAIIATNPEHKLYLKLKQIEEHDVQNLEDEMADLLQKNPLEPYFYLPGSETSLGGAYIDVARTLARKAERRLVHYMNETSRNDLSICLKYINRLSDYLFVLARYLSNFSNL